MKIDKSVWNKPDRLRKRIMDLAKIILSITAVNAFYTLSQKNWIIFGINVLFFITTIPVFLSKAKWDKKPPQIQNE